LKEDINLFNFPIEPKKIQKIVLIGCGTAYHACLSAKHWFEEITTLEAETDVASEFRYRKIRFNKNNLYIFVSQSGETADTFAALDLCKKNGVKTCSVINVIESSIARSSDFILPIHAGPEIGVASTKAFIGQMLVLYILALKISEVRNEISKENYINKIAQLKKLPDLISETLKCEGKIQIIAKDIHNSKGVIFLGRGPSFPIALEGALKLKELSYLNAEGYPAGEMKHGPLALIEEGLPVVILAPQDRYFEKTISNMQEVIARGGKVLLITNEKNNIISENIRFTLEVPKTDNYLTSFLTTIPLQLLAYHIASLKNLDIDKPRNLAKSVTVE
jgi:glutamine---fructose-6-phosphate transaminase (isomerizing)